MKKFLISNIIAQIIITALSIYYASELATGWDGIVVMFVLIVAVPIVLMDMIVLTVKIIKDRKRKQLLNSEIELDANDISTSETINQNKNSRKITVRKLFKIALIVISIIATLFEAFLIGSSLYDDYVLHNMNYSNEEDVYVRTEREVVKYAKKEWKHIELLNVSPTVIEDEYDDKVIEGKLYTFKDTMYEFEFTITQYIDCVDGWFSSGGYQEILDDNYGKKYEEYVSEKVVVMLGDRYDNDVLTIDSVYFWANEITVNVIVEMDTTEQDIESAISQLSDIARIAKMCMRDVDLERKYGEDTIIGPNIYEEIHVELNRSWTLDNGFRQYDVIGMYYMENDEYKSARRDLDGIVLPENEW